ncbi:sodium-dependent bicarbonate transport family permease [Pacificimonas sp. WHA3]|uniref:Sodium-dependent bicarbonate transport family permease n=1 Tax=Pacificimonas pallii TaxID=2827236 RepID=A0ABS6SF46_9SPHN|nr:sodium-dependent bicarbonate transport family permease [Pacificimonas pallii]MBV7256546.1 sodium-dependent bicarbonate transport family permease [Pacificimonas pallii]
MDAAISTLLSPVILFFILGGLAGFARSDLAIPESIAKGMSLYLMAAIGLKGGVQVAEAGFSLGIVAALAAGLALGFILPLIAYPALRWFGRLDGVNAGAVAAHYGSVSVVTFVTGVEVLTVGDLAPAGYMVAVLALMETPAILVGLFLANRSGAAIGNGEGKGGALWREVLLNGSVVLLVGSFLIGIIAGKDGFTPIAPMFETAFRGVLCLFLLDMGLVAARRLTQSRALTVRLSVLAIALPILNGTIGALVGILIGLDVGSASALAILAASASYIAVPAAMRMALPRADAGLYLALSLGITFPFNITVGIPLYTALASWFAGVIA